MFTNLPIDRVISHHICVRYEEICADSSDPFVDVLVCSLVYSFVVYLSTVQAESFLRLSFALKTTHFLALVPDFNRSQLGPTGLRLQKSSKNAVLIVLRLLNVLFVEVV